MMKMRYLSMHSIALSLIIFSIGVSGSGECGTQHGGTLCQEGFCCSTHGYCGTTSDYCGPGNCQSQCPTPSSPPPPSPPPPPFAPPPPVSPDDVSTIVSRELYDEMFPNRFYGECDGGPALTYDGFISAARTFPEFGRTGSPAIRKREIAAFFGQTSHETTGGWATAEGGPYKWGYCFVRERNQLDYCTPSTEWPCVPGQKYFGRGPIQLTHNYNYGPAGKHFGLDLLSNPDLVATDPKLSFQTALWFWMTPQSPKPSCHDVIVGKWIPSAADVEANRLPGYGMLTNIINGGYECGSGSPTDAETDRIGFYQRYCPMLGTTTGDNVSCYNQKHYGVTLVSTTTTSTRSRYYGVLKMPLVDKAMF